MSKKVLITGVSGGFGSLTAKTLKNKGYEVVGSMRSKTGKNESVAKELEDLGVHLVEMDVTSDESVLKGVEETIEKLGGLDVVVNNAGVGVTGMQEHFDISDWHKVFEVNLFGVQRVNRAVLPHLRKQRSGTIVYVSSLLGRMTLPFYGPYNSSKWALEAMVENYRLELSGFGIENVIIEPGGFPTTFFENLIVPSDQSRNEEYGEFMNVPQKIGEAFGKVLQSNPQQNPQLVADAILGVLEKPIGEKPFRVPVDKLGMGDAVSQALVGHDKMEKDIYTNFQIEGMVEVLK